MKELFLLEENISGNLKSALDCSTVRTGLHVVCGTVVMVYGDHSGMLLSRYKRNFLVSMSAHRGNGKGTAFIYDCYKDRTLLLDASKSEVNYSAFEGCVGRKVVRETKLEPYSTQRVSRTGMYYDVRDRVASEVGFAIQDWLLG